MEQLELEVLEAKKDEARLSELIAGNKQWILRCASETTRRYITDSDDEWSIALMAFSEAVQNYVPEKGLFRGFAAVVIRRRILDYLRKENRHMAETSVEPAAFEGGMEEPAGVDLQVQKQVAQTSTENQADDLAARTREEIAEAQALFRPYGFSFYDLADCSPRAEKTKRSCALAVRALLDDPELMARLRRTGALPMRDLSSDSRVPRKILDRHRRYIIAAAELLSGDFPILSAYMDYIRKV
ncbi:MAG: RNA polymerase subunit sigma [Oscillibacter sp.]|nr:RNA polymerase subunit sigma [Oscillibacter sp.]